MKVNAKYAGPKLTTSKLKNMASYGFCENEIEKIKETWREVGDSSQSFSSDTLQGISSE